MNDPTVDKPRSQQGNDDRRSRRMKSKVGGVAIVVLAALYAFLQPILNEKFDLNLPAIRSQSNGDASIVAADSKAPEPVAPNSTSIASSAGNDSAPPPSTSADESTGDEDLLYGLLKEVSPKRYVSPAGLQYNPGSAEGHRLEHLRRHTKDDPGRAGSHGVFEGDMEGALQTIDKAYQRAKKGQSTTKQTDGDRTIYTVDMGGRVGFVGGRDGSRKRNPMARRVRLVLEGTRVITAYPL